MHRKFLSLVAFVIILVAILFPWPLVLMCCGMVGAVMVLAFVGICKVYVQRVHSREDVVLFRQLGIAGLVVTLAFYGAITGVALKVLEGGMLYLGFATMACTVGLVCGWVASAFLLERDSLRQQG